MQISQTLPDGHQVLGILEGIFLRLFSLDMHFCLIYPTNHLSLSLSLSKWPHLLFLLVIFFYSKSSVSFLKKGNSISWILEIRGNGIFSLLVLCLFSHFFSVMIFNAKWKKFRLCFSKKNLFSWWDSFLSFTFSPSSAAHSLRNIPNWPWSVRLSNITRCWLDTSQSGWDIR